MLRLNLFAVLCIFCALSQSNSYAQERTEESFIPNYAVASSYFSWGAETDFDGGFGSFQNLETGVEANIPLHMGDSFRLTAGFKYRWNQLDFVQAAAPFGSSELDLYRLEVPINAWIDLNDRWKFWGRLQPGIATDFETVDSDDFTLSALALFSYRWNDWLKVAFGGFYSRDLGEERLLPAVGFIIEPNHQLSLALTFPRVQLAYAPSPDFLVTGSAILNGASWNITDPNGSDTDIDLNYRAIRAGLGIDHRIKGPFWAYVQGGYQFGQELEIDDGDTLSIDLDSGAYATGGVKLRF